MLWNQTYGAKHSSITSALETPNGYLLLSISNLTDVGLILTDEAGYQLWKTTFPEVRLPVGLEANFNSIISAKDGGYIMVGSKNESVWLAKIDIQQSGLIALQLLPILGAGVAVAVIATVVGKRKRASERLKR